MLCYILLLSVELFSPYFFFFNDTATTEIYTLSLHDALPIFQVDALGVLAYSVGDDRIELAGVVHGASGRQMAPVGEIRAEHGVAGLEQGEVDGHVGLGARVGLDVDVLGAEELLGARDRQVLDDADDLAAA